MLDTLHITVIACGVFEEELRALAEESANEVEVRLLDAGLHAAPEELRLRAQHAIDRASRDGCDAVCLGYGLCGRGTAGLRARGVPLVVPRVHDCIGLFLGSPRAYREQFARHPGTFYFTTGWYEKKGHPERSRLNAAGEFDPTTHPRFEEFRENYGEGNARWIVEFLESWRRNYNRAALIDHGMATPEHERMTRTLAEAAGWEYERIEGSLRMLRDLVEGNWEDGRFLVAEPGQVLLPTNDQRVLCAVATGEAPGPAASPVESRSFVIGGEGSASAGGPAIALGIDAGGTYTDAAIYRTDTEAVLGKAKAPTTHHNLSEGIAAALAKLDRSRLEGVDCVCLSTTLATNAVVEGRGRPVGLLLMPRHPRGARRLNSPRFRCLGARMTIEGRVERAVDEGEVLTAARELVEEGVQAFAVSGYGATRNPRQELRVKSLLGEHFDLPVVCGHELTGRLNFLARADTAVLNARLVPLIEELLDAVERTLEQAGVEAPLFVVRGDGSIVRKDVARDRPVDTILSGPAASTAGAAALSGCSEALVVDMGGTTTDTAILKDGVLSVEPEGAQVGGWRTSVAAVEVLTEGLGGDSVVRPAGEGAVTVGPGRVLPLCMLAATQPGITEEIGRIVRGGRSHPDEPLEFFVLERTPDEMDLGPRQRRILEVLSDGPRRRHALAKACGYRATSLVPVGRLESLGLVRRSAATPTDALHVLGEYTRYDVEAARTAMLLLGRQIGRSAEGAARVVRRETERLLSLGIMRRELGAGPGQPGMAESKEAEHLLNLAAGGGAPEAAEGESPFRLRWEQARPVVAVGAPAGAFLPGACGPLDTEPAIPPHAEVAGAVGAAVSRVRARARARVRPRSFGGYVLYGPEGRGEYGGLGSAVEAACRAVTGEARRRGREFGTPQQRVNVEVRPRTGRLKDGSSQLLEVLVEGSLAGRPAGEPAPPKSSADG